MQWKQKLAFYMIKFMNAQLLQAEQEIETQFDYGINKRP
jgi:hypothetical protein